MESKVNLNMNGTNYLKKGEEPTFVKKEGRYTILETMRHFANNKGEIINKINSFKVSNELLKIWFK